MPETPTRPRRARVSGARLARLTRTGAVVASVAVGTTALLATPAQPAASAAGRGSTLVAPTAAALALSTAAASSPAPATTPDLDVRAGASPSGSASAAAPSRVSRSSWRDVPRIVRDGRTVADWRLGTQGMLWPVPGEKTSGGTGWRVHPVYGYKSCHTGVDIQGTWGTPVLAALPGTVVRVDDDKVYGRRTVIDHGNGLSTMYAHQDVVHVRVGRRVARGQVIGEVGSSGWVTGPHLHFEVHRDGMPFDPLGWFLSSHQRVAVSCAHDVGY